MIRLVSVSILSLALVLPLLHAQSPPPHPPSRCGVTPIKAKKKECRTFGCGPNLICECDGDRFGKWIEYDATNSPSAFVRQLLKEDFSKICFPGINVEQFACLIQERNFECSIPMMGDGTLAIALGQKGTRPVCTVRKLKKASVFARDGKKMVCVL